MAGDAIEAISVAVGVLGEHPDPAVQAIGSWLATWPAELIEELSGIENGAGRSARDSVLLERRNILLCRLGETASPVRLDAELRRYHTDVWLPRDRVKMTCPYSGEDRRATLWALFRLWPQPVSLRYLRIILGRQP
jgi:hypothetical protein